MSFSSDSAAKRAVEDLADRLGVSESDVSIVSVKDREFPDMSLGAGVDGEMAAQMISSGWQIDLQSGGRGYEYRADKYQLRLVGFRGTNYLVAS